MTERTIINMTQHEATEDQRAAGVIEPLPKDQRQELLTFKTLPEGHEVWWRAREVACVAATLCKRHRTSEVLIAGAGFLMLPLTQMLWSLDLTPLWSFSERVAEESPGEDGVVELRYRFKHTGFVEVENLHDLF